MCRAQLEQLQGQINQLKRLLAESDRQFVVLSLAHRKALDLVDQLIREREEHLSKTEPLEELLQRFGGSLAGSAGYVSLGRNRPSGCGSKEEP